MLAGRHVRKCHVNQEISGSVKIFKEISGLVRKSEGKVSGNCGTSENDIPWKSCWHGYCLLTPLGAPCIFKLYRGELQKK
jgi:hypothetical protein